MIKSGDLAALALLGLICGAPSAATAGGVALDEDDHDHAYYFGFVKDMDGSAVPGAKVAAKLKNISIITHSDVLGAYKIPVFNADLKPEDVGLSCSKDGYRQADVIRRSAPGGDGKEPVEIDCTLQHE
jgi:hypothetical protein